jgi:glycosyltransferase involved in cell wall biosynthesis
MTVRSPLAAIGITLHNQARYLPEALDSLLAQSCGDFTAVMVDDGSTDETGSIARAYASRDTRLRYVRLPQRSGMVGAWQRAYEEATANGARYFAWGSDHDRWHPDWLATLVAALDRNPAVVLAYPLTQRIDIDGRPLDKPARQFDTLGVTDLRDRWKLLSRSDAVAAGDMVYGLMRVDAVKKAGVFRPVLCPDRLLIAELTLQGQIHQEPAVLWYRRRFAVGSINRQRATLFAPGAKTPSRLTPAWYLHGRSLWKTYGDARLAVEYSAAYAWRHYAKSSVQRGVLSVLGWPRWIYKRIKHAVLLAVYEVLVTLRKMGMRGQA